MKAAALLDSFIAKRKATVKQLMCLTRHLNFLSRALNFGRPFIRRIYNKIRPFQNKLRWHVNLGQEVREDLAMWKSFILTEPHHKAFIVYLEMPADEVAWYTNVSGSQELGFGCYLNGDWMVGVWRPNFIQPGTSMCLLELFAVAVSVEKWAEHFPNKCMIIHCDNSAAIAVMNNLTACCTKCLFLVRKMVLTCMKYNMRIRVQYITSENDTIADSLSRFQWDHFFQLVPGAQQSPEVLPQSLWPLLESLLSA